MADAPRVERAVRRILLFPLPCPASSRTGNLREVATPDCVGRSRQVSLEGERYAERFAYDRRAQSAPPARILPMKSFFTAQK